MLVKALTLIREIPIKELKQQTPTKIIKATPLTKGTTQTREATPILSYIDTSTRHQDKP